MSLVTLHIKALIFRTLQTIFTYLDIYLSFPIPHRPSYTLKIPSTISPIPGFITILFYTPPTYTKSLPPTSNNPASPLSTSPSPSPKKHPLLINFHGGGFTIGSAHDDARWATTVTQHSNAIVASIAYRLAPSHPFPSAIEDCVSAILYLWKHADEHNLDISRTSLSGFSAGGNLVYAVSIRLHEELTRLHQQQQEQGKVGQWIERGRVVSLLVFYGSSDWTQTRLERDASNPNLIPTIPSSLFRLFDDAYLYPPPLDMRSPYLSPGLASQEVLREAFPERVVMVDCGGDQLLAESGRFAERLVGMGKRVERRVVEGVGHG